jgi:hypothetical protein
VHFFEIAPLFDLSMLTKLPMDCLYYSIDLCDTIRMVRDHKDLRLAGVILCPLSVSTGSYRAHNGAKCFLRRFRRFATDSATFELGQSVGWFAGGSSAILLLK